MALILAAQTIAAAQPARDSELCRSQLELLIRGNKLTEAEIKLFEQQCACLAEQEQADTTEKQSCAQQR